MTLFEKLFAAGLPISEATEDGAISGLPGVVMTPEQETLCRNIIREHFHPAEYVVEQRIQARHDAAQATAKAIPVWASWTQAQWQTYFTTNLSDSEADLVITIAAARVMIKRQNLVIQNLVKMVIAMRDQIWPSLPE